MYKNVKDSISKFKFNRIILLKKKINNRNNLNIIN